MTPEASGLSPGAPLLGVGRATRFACAGGGAVELWRLPANAERVANRLAALGGRGVGGFVAVGRDDAGPWLARRAGAPDLATWLGGEPGPIAWPRAVALAASLADAAAACEQLALFPGAIEPAQLVVVGESIESIEIRADVLVHALVGATLATPPSTRWLAPEHVAGRAADNASNRYAIGLVLYWLLTGEHPFAGRGMRAGLDDQAERGAPPFAPEIAGALPPGLQAACLRMLDPQPAKRPANAEAIAKTLRGFVDDAARARTSAPRTLASAADATAAPKAGTGTGAGPGGATDARLDGPPRERMSQARVAAAAPPRERGLATESGRRRWVALFALGPIAIGAALAGWAIASIEPALRVATPAHEAAPMRARELADCASCHPRQAAEWSRSVMAHAIESPLFESLEMLIEEQIGRDRRCPDGAGVLRAAGGDPCRSPRTGLAITGSGGALWCVNCHSPGENLAAAMPPWDAHARDPRTRRPLRDLLPASTMEGVSCAACHQMTGPAHPGDRYDGNPSWISADTGARFLQRPEDERGLFGIANSGYSIDLLALVGGGDGVGGGELVPGGAHRRTAPAALAYRRSSEMCGACHDVRLFGTDALGVVERGEHFKRLRNAYSEWAAWAADERRAGNTPASCQDCHMSLYPGVCVTSPGAPAARGCPTGTAFEARRPGALATGHGAAGSLAAPLASHYFTGVDVPLSRAFDPLAIADAGLDVAGVPLGARQRRDQLLASAFRFEIAGARRVIESPDCVGARSNAQRCGESIDRLEIPIFVENIGAGHRVPAGFSQEREIWVHLRVADARGRTIYEVGRVDRGDADLRDKLFVRVNTSSASVDRSGRSGEAGAFDRSGRPLGLFGADVADGPDVPQWTASDDGFRGRGLVNFQNGFLRCVRCLGTIDERGRCQPGPGQGTRRADRYADGDYDADTGECRSNLVGANAFVEIYFPVGALDATRGIVKGPDAIVDTRSLAPNRPARYVYDLAAIGDGPFTVEATLEFRAFPPYLVRAFADYEAEQARLGLRPSGPLVDRSALDRLEVVDVATARAVIR